MSEISKLEEGYEAEDVIWDAAFASSIKVLEVLAQEALVEYEAGKTLQLNLDLIPNLDGNAKN